MDDCGQVTGTRLAYRLAGILSTNGKRHTGLECCQTWWQLSANDDRYSVRSFCFLQMVPSYLAFATSPRLSSAKKLPGSVFYLPSCALIPCFASLHVLVPVHVVSQMSNCHYIFTCRTCISGTPEPLLDNSGRLPAIACRVVCAAIPWRLPATLAMISDWSWALASC